MQTPHDEEHPAGQSRRARFVMGLLVGVVVTAGSIAVVDRVATPEETIVAAVPVVVTLPADEPVAVPVSPPVSADVSRRNAIVHAVEDVSPAVVTISVTLLRRERSVPFADPMWRYFFPDMGREFVRKSTSMGSGFIISDDGVIVTNEHVVRGATDIEVSLPDGRLFSGSIVGEADPQTDLALIKISGEDLPVAPLGTSEDLMIGEWAIAMGNPFGYLIRDAHPTVTVGVISALNRDFDASSSSDQVYRDMIQTDASINPGNSGGPLVSSEGKVIGVNTFIFSQSGGSQGIGFAIPVRRVRMIVDDILRYGEVRHNFWTGIHIQEVDRWIAETLGLPADRGAIIYDVEAQSPGEKAGLRRGDVIVAVAGRRVDGTREVREEFAGAVVGQQVELIVVREGRETVVPITLEEMPAARRRRG